VAAGGAWYNHSPYVDNGGVLAVAAFHWFVATLGVSIQRGLDDNIEGG